MPKKDKTEDAKKQERSNYRFYFLIGATGTIAIADPVYPLALRFLFVAGLLVAIVLNFTRIFGRLWGANFFEKYEPQISGCTDGISIIALAFLILAFYFKIKIPIPFS